MSSNEYVRHRYSVSLVSQGRHKFYTLTMPSDVLAKSSFVSTRDEDPAKGFQRLLDKERAKQIAEYIDDGLGTIPSSIVLSAQPDADLRIIGKGKTVEFTAAPKAFLVIDGQHRVFGFALAKTALRVPVVIYNGLSRADEAKLFIDINTKQRPVPNELLLDIKKLAEYESDSEQLFGELFDRFNADAGSPLLGKMSPNVRATGKLSRVTFNAALKPLIEVFGPLDVETIYGILRDYITAVATGCSGRGADGAIANPIVFRSFLALFPDVAERVRDRFGGSYNVANFVAVMEPAFARLKRASLERPGQSVKASLLRRRPESDTAPACQTLLWRPDVGSFAFNTRTPNSVLCGHKCVFDCLVQDSFG